jgi:hypothetical protein
MTGLVPGQVGGLDVWLAPNLQAHGIPHAFTTRRGGISEGPFAALNLGLATGDEPLRVAANRATVAMALGREPERLRMVRQVHGHRVVDAAGVVSGEPEADGLVSDDPTWLVGVQVADCLPILLADPEGTVVAAVHAGWRGLAAGIVPLAVALVAERSGKSPAGIIGAVGPAIGAARYVVGLEVAEHFDATFLTAGEGGRRHLDLTACAAAQLQAAGLVDLAVATTCTYEQRDEFFSHRRDGPRTGRQGGFIASRGR